jgi:hypothetical protein
MSIIDRLSDVIKSYLNDEDESIFGKQENSSRSKDADYNAAYNELNEFLNKDKAKTYSWKDEDSDFHDKTANESQNNMSYTDYLKEEMARKQAERKAEREKAEADARAYAESQEKKRQKKTEANRNESYQNANPRNTNSRNANSNVPEILRNDFAELGIAFGSSLIECKTSYKALLKKHHPDRHAGHERNMKKATEKSARINVSYHKIEVWYETGKIE